MAKTTTKNQARNTAPQASAPTSPVKLAGVPQGYENADERFEVSGFWRPDAGALHGVLLGGYKYKQKRGKGKGGTRTVFVFRLLNPCIARVKLEGGGFDDTELAKDELVGVFGSPGLRALNDCAGCSVFLQRMPEKKTLENGNEMWMFDIRFKGARRPLRVRDVLEVTKDDAPEDDSFDSDAF